MFPTNPCQSCGACCGYFRVSFYWREADAESGGTVPIEMTRQLDPFRRCMKGTDQEQPRCIALSGQIGSSVCCTIYENRPSPCREFGVNWSNGLLSFIPEDLERCTQARAAYGLPPLFHAPYPNAPSIPDASPEMSQKQAG